MTFVIWADTRLLHPQHFDGILTRLTLYRVPLDPLSEYPEPWSWKMSGSEREKFVFSVFWKKLSPRHGGEIVWKRNRVQEFLDSVFFLTISPPCLGLLFFSRILKKQISWTLFFFSPFPPHVWDSVFFRTLKKQISLSHFLTFFRTRVLNTHYWGQAAPCTGSALSKFNLSVGDGET